MQSELKTLSYACRNGYLNSFTAGAVIRLFDHGCKHVAASRIEGAPHSSNYSGPVPCDLPGWRAAKIAAKGGLHVIILDSLSRFYHNLSESVSLNCNDSESRTGFIKFIFFKMRYETSENIASKFPATEGNPRKFFRKTVLAFRNKND